MSKTGSTFPSNYENSIMGRTTGQYFNNGVSRQYNIQTGQPNNLYLNEYQRQMARIQNNKNRDELLLKGGWYGSYPKFEPKGSFNTPLSLNGNTSDCNCDQPMQGRGLLRTKEVQEYYNKLLQDRKQQIDAQQQMMEGQTNLIPQKVEEGIDNIEMVNVDILSTVQAISDLYFDGNEVDIKEGMLKSILSSIIKYGLSLKSDVLKSIRDSFENIIFNAELVLGSETFSENIGDKITYDRLTELYGSFSPERKENLEQRGEELRRQVGRYALIGEPKIKYFYRIRNLVNHLLETKNLSDRERKMSLLGFLRTSKLGQVIGRQVKPITPEETLERTVRNIKRDTIDREVENLYDRKIRRELEMREFVDEGEEEGEGDEEEVVTDEEGAGRRKYKKSFLKGGMVNEEEKEEQDQDPDQPDDNEDEARRVLRDLRPELEEYLNTINDNYNMALEGARDDEFRLTEAQVRAEQAFVKGEANEIITYLEDIKNQYNNRYINAFIETKLNQIYKKIALTSQIISITSKPYERRLDLLRRLEEDPESEPAGARGQGKRKYKMKNIKRKPNKNIKKLLGGKNRLKNLY